LSRLPGPDLEPATKRLTVSCFKGATSHGDTAPTEPSTRDSAESNARHLIGEGPPQIATDAAAVPDHPDDLGAAADARPWQGDGMAWPEEARSNA